MKKVVKKEEQKSIKKIDIKEFIKNIDKKKVLYGVCALILLIVLIIIIVKANTKEVDGITYNEEKDIYEINDGKIVIEDDFEISYNVVTKKYKISGTITNKTKKDYKNLELTFEFYNQEKEVIDTVAKTVKEIKANDKTNMEFEIDETSVLIYDYKIVNVKTK